MTTRTRPTGEQLADEMRARVLSHRGAWVALQRPKRRLYDESAYTDRDDDRRLPLWHRDPRAVELEYDELRIEFWLAADAAQVHFIARRALVLARHLARRALDPEQHRAA